MCLPVWRELKPFMLMNGHNLAKLSSHVPSRLEGIETFLRVGVGNRYVGSHVPSRLEGIETE